jgi:sulfoxide reductase catalytic subunit YedY
MANIIIPPGWRIPDREATPESVYFDRRAFLRSAGLGIAAVGVAGCGTEFIPTQVDRDPVALGGCDETISHPFQSICASPNMSLYPAEPNAAYQVPERAETERSPALSFNNFYEFIGVVGETSYVWPYVGPLEVWPWTVEVTGEAELTGTFDISDLEREFGLEERLYRHRCVEGWSMVVPWTGYTLAKLIQKFRPLSSATFVRFVSFNLPDQAVGQRLQPDLPWPFFEALRMDEALNELAFVATGVFGEPLPKQNGAPWRLAIPWKYGFKSAKSIVRIEFVSEQPSTFWPTIEPSEYGFYSNVNPNVAHPRWSQKLDRPLGSTMKLDTMLFNGYEDYVSDLYDPSLLTHIS